MLVEVIAEGGPRLRVVESASAGWVLAPRRSNLDGWWSLSPRFETAARPGLDGDFAPGRLLVESRVVTIAAHFLGGSRADVQDALSDTARLLKRFVRLVVTDGELVQHGWGFVAERVAVENIANSVVSVSLIVKMSDPLKYAGRGEGLADWETATGFWAETVSGGLLFPLADQSPRDDVTVSGEPTLLFTEGGLTNSVECVNVGGADSWPILEATGPFDWCQWVCAGQVVRWETPVAEGDTLQINTHSGEIVVGGLPGYVTSFALDEFFPLVPGENVVAFQASHPSRYRVRWLSAWL